MKTITLKNKHFDILAKILGEDLPFQRSRKRKIFIDAILPKLKARDEARMDIVNKYGEKGEDGKLKVVEGNYKLTDIENFKKDYTDLMEEDVVIDIPPSVEYTMDVVKDIVINTDIKVTNTEVELIEEIIKAIE
jgi:hypothetical protein